MPTPETFRAFVAERTDDDVARELTTLRADELPEGEVTIRVGYSSVNYKDALAVAPKGRVATVDRLVPGIDLAGEVVESSDDGVPAGTAVLAHGHEIGTGRHGGFAEYARVPAAWVVPLPDGLTARRAMAIGTAGFTAALSVRRLEDAGVAPGEGPVLVLGASGGVGSLAVALLARRGHEVCASTGKADQAEFLRGLGAGEVLSREEATAGKRPLERQRWAGVVDTVGGTGLAYALTTVRYGGAIASSGLTAGTTLETTVMPFILRSVSLLGVDSVQTPMDLRRDVWAFAAEALADGEVLDGLTREVGLEDLDAVLGEIARGAGTGRTVVRVGG
jgi:putative YhdH/YhfP family quinone oxidoreductase